MSNKDKLELIKEYQESGIVHPLTCGNDSSHNLLEAVEDKGKVILRCTDCEYVQGNIPKFVYKIKELKANHPSYNLDHPLGRARKRRELEKKGRRYVITFMFTEDLSGVWMIEKNKPEWQKGCVNGIGGKIETGEMPTNAAIRELKEEGGVEFNEYDVLYVGLIEGDEFQVEVYTGVTDQKLKTVESEGIKLIPKDDVRLHKHIDNIPLLIEACLLKIKNPSVNKIKINYT